MGVREHRRLVTKNKRALRNFPDTAVDMTSLLDALEH